MKRACIVTVDAARARICLYQQQARPGFELVEYRDLDNAGRRLKVSEMVSDRGDMASNGGQPYDDHRFAKLEQMDARFAKLVLETVTQVMHAKKLAHVILIAPPKMLGVLRAAGGLAHPGVRADEITSDMSKLSIAQLHDQLAARELIPPRARYAVAR